MNVEPPKYSWVDDKCAPVILGTTFHFLCFGLFESIAWAFTVDSSLLLREGARFHCLRSCLRRVVVLKDPLKWLLPSKGWSPFFAAWTKRDLCNLSVKMSRDWDILRKKKGRIGKKRKQNKTKKPLKACRQDSALQIPSLPTMLVTRCN